ncbi:MAG TPA: hypothetical protein VI195_04815 [Steroidobacteraceae bacterium]
MGKAPAPEPGRPIIVLAGGHHGELLVEGKIDPEVYERWNRAAGDQKLPEHVRKKKRKKRKR